jgi:hypothetical protein
VNKSLVSTFITRLTLLTSVTFVLASCTGKVPTDAGGIVITGAQSIQVDMTDANQLNLGSDYTVTLKTITPDYSSNTDVLDLTSQIQTTVSANGVYNFVLAKNLQIVRPLVVVVNIPSLNAQLVDVILGNETSFKPGINSTLAYNFIKYYPGRILTDYSADDFNGIKNLVTARTAQLQQESEYLSPNTVRFDQIIRYFTNGMAFNQTFLTQAQAFGVNYGFTLVAPPNLVASDTPENSLASYQYASSFTVNGAPVTNNPFDQLNSPPTLLPGSQSPNPGSNILVNEGSSVAVTAQAFDLDDDFVDKSFIVQYVPRVLPVSIVPPYVIPEPTPEYTTLADISAPNALDTYHSQAILFNEALDLTSYGAPADTAYRNVYYSVSDGMMRIPFRWNFKYNDVNRPPQISTTLAGAINDTSYDASLPFPSLCESTNGTNGTVDQNIHSRADGPWSCTFKVYDPDLDADPNAAADTYNFGVYSIDSATLVNVRNPAGSITNIWPPISPYTLTAPYLLPSTILPTCVDKLGVTHRKCGVGTYEIPIDNAVKVSAESQSDSIYTYGIQVYDRPASGLSASHLVSREVEFTPNPARLINFAQVTAPAGSDNFQTTAGSGANIHYTRTDAYLNELAIQVDPTSTLTLDKFGFSTNAASNDTLKNTLAGAGNRGNFLAGVVNPVTAADDSISSYITQPRDLTQSLYLDITTGIIYSNPVPAGTPSVVVPTGLAGFLGHSQTNSDATTYSAPREFDSTCLLDANNSGTGWDQTVKAYPTPVAGTSEVLVPGWTFEIDALDIDNVQLRPGEPSDPVYLSLANDVATGINRQGDSILFCNPLAPNTDSSIYQIYSQIGNVGDANYQPAVDADRCSWKQNPPATLQPMPVFYSQNVNGVNMGYKFVYHRLRVKWQPKDQGTLVGRTPEPYFIKNLINSISLSGNTYAHDQTKLEDLSVLSNLQITAIRQDMKPCVVHQFGQYNVVHEKAITGVPTNFLVQDENKTLPDTPGINGGLSGKYNADLTLLGTRSIINQSFMQFAPFIQNCTQEFTKGTPLNEPMYWYSINGDGANMPHARLSSYTDPIYDPVNLDITKVPLCLNFSYNPLSDSSGNPYAEVVLITNLTNATQTLNLGSCFSRTTLPMNATEQSILAVRKRSAGCPSHVAGDVLWSDGNTMAQVKYVLDPTAYGFTIPNFKSLDLFPNLYGTTLPMPQIFNANTNAFVATASNPANVPGTLVTAPPLAVDAANLLFFDLHAIDNFSLTNGLPSNIAVATGGFVPVTYTTTGTYPVTAPTPRSMLGPTPAPVSTYNTPAYLTDPYWPGLPVCPSCNYKYAYTSSMWLGYVDWDDQPTNLNLVAPTPDPTTVFTRLAPGSTSDIQVYIKGTTYSQVTVPFSSSSIDPANLDLEEDPFDVFTFAFGTPTPSPAPVNTPTLTGVGRADCSTLPAGYPANLNTLNYTSLLNYRMCNFNWTPTANDGGHHYIFQLFAQDNPSSDGGRYPSGGVATVPSNTATAANGPLTNFTIEAEVLEANSGPYFSGTTGSTYTSAAVPAGSAWKNVYAGTGVQPTCASPHSGYSCSLSVAAGDLLQNSSASPAMLEGATTPFTLTANEDNVTLALRTLSVSTPPTGVLIVDGPYAGQTFKVPSFTNMAISQTTASPCTGLACFTFTWTPTDLEAYSLSNPGGFLIPFTVTNQPYIPATDAGFPTTFDTPAKQSTVWIWAKLQVRNNQPIVYAINSAGVATNIASGGTLTFQTGVTTNYTLQVNDADTARFTVGGESSGFSLTPDSSPATVAFVTPTPSALTYSPTYSVLTQPFKLSGTPTNAMIGTYTMNITVTDPGDPSLGLALNPNGASPPRAQVYAGGNTYVIPVTVNVIGRPIFQVPSTASSQVYAYTSSPLTYPLSLSISRPTEKGLPFFIGLNSADTLSPMKHVLTDGGIYVNEKYMLKWNASNTIAYAGNRNFQLYAINQALCNSSLTSPAFTLLRFNETTNLIETCKLAATNQTNDLASQAMSLNLVANSALAIPAITGASLSRPYLNASPSTIAYDLGQQYVEFKARCAYCGTAVHASSGASPSGYTLNASANTGSVEFQNGGYDELFAFNTTAGVSVTKTYSDYTPSSSHSIIASAIENETLTLSATVASAPGSAPYSQYRWYVNGCLRAGGLMNSTTISQPFALSTLQAGLNNDCTGEYSISETNSAKLGSLTIRLNLASGTETATSTSDGSTVSYVWKVTVLNTAPNLQTDPSSFNSPPLVMSPTNYTGNQASSMATVSTLLGTDYFAYTDLGTTGAGQGLRVHLLQMDTSGNLPVADTNILLNCSSSFTSQPAWMGVQPQTDGKFYISASTTKNFPIGTSAAAAYGNSSGTCYGSALSPTTGSVSSVNEGNNSTDPAGYLAFSTNSISTFTTAHYANVSAPYKTGTYDSNYYLVSGTTSAEKFWSNAMAQIYTGTITAISGYSNALRKSMFITVSDGTSRLVQFFGGSTTGSANWRGYLLIDSFTTSATQIKVAAANATSVMFALPGDSPAPGANDCSFEGTPLDGVYVAGTDTLYALVYSSNTLDGKIVAIRSASTTAPSCSLVGSVMNPSLATTDHNANLPKIAYDSVNGMIYGVITQQKSLGGASQVFAFDAYAEKLNTQLVPSGVVATEIIFSPTNNAVYLYSGTRSGSIYPTLYRVW